MTSTPPGWYDDGHGSQRWWDGAGWTENVQPAGEGAPAPVAAEAAPRPDATDGAPLSGPGSPDAAMYPGAVPPSESYPESYPGAYPPPPEKKKSKLWIVWVVIGVIVLGLVIGAIALIPMLLGAFGAGGGSGGEAGSDADEQAAVAAVESWTQAWAEVDCDKFVAATTADFRAAAELEDCATFEGQAQTFSDAIDGYDVTVESIDRAEDTITVTTTETYQYLVDENGEPLDEPESVDESWAYTVVPSEGGWAINDATNE